MTRPGNGRRTARLRQFEQLLDVGAGGEQKAMTFMDWASRVPEPRSGPLDFDLFPFQRELYTEGVDDREIVVMKSTQVGVSAWASRWAMYHSDVHRRTGLYVFPTQDQVRDFSAARIKPAIDASEYLRGRQRNTDPSSKGLIGLGGGMVYFRGSQERRNLDSVDADYVVLDEYDMLAQENIPDAERRVSGPRSAGLIRRVGVPTVPGSGIAQLYEVSDRRQWHVKCEACNEWQTIDFFENVDQVRMIRVCCRCTKPLDMGKGEWVAEHPDRDTRGYHVTRLIAPSASIERIVKASKLRAPYEKQVFFNKDLGLAYAPEEGRLSKEALAAAQSAGGGYTIALGYAGGGVVTMGVDVASTRNLNVRVSEHLPDGERKKALWIGEAESFNDLGLLMERFGVNMCAIDHLPEGRLARAFAERFPGRVYLVSYDGTPNPKDSNVIKVDEEMRHARVRRVEAIDAMAEMLREQKNLLPMDLPEGYVEQMQANVRVASKDEMGKVTVAYRKVGGADDYAHAEVYDIVATEIYWLRQGIEEAEREVYRPLDDLLDFQRSRLADYDSGVDYHPGPADEPYDHREGY